MILAEASSPWALVIFTIVIAVIIFLSHYFHSNLAYYEDLRHRLLAARDRTKAASPAWLKKVGWYLGLLLTISNVIFKAIYHTFVLIAELIAEGFEKLSHSNQNIEDKTNTIQPFTFNAKAHLTEDHAQKLAGIAITAWGQTRFDLQTRTKKFQHWLRANPDCMKLIVTEDGFELGYTCILPVTEEVYDRFRREFFSQFSVEPKDIIASKPANRIILQAVCIPPSTLEHYYEKRRTEHNEKKKEVFCNVFYSLIGQSIHEHISQLCSFQNMPKILADTCEDGGRWYAKSKGFEQIGKNYLDKTDIWELNCEKYNETNHGNLNPDAIKAIEMFKDYQVKCQHRTSPNPVPVETQRTQQTLQDIAIPVEKL